VSSVALTSRPTADHYIHPAAAAKHQTGSQATTSAAAAAVAVVEAAVTADDQTATAAVRTAKVVAGRMETVVVWRTVRVADRMAAVGPAAERVVAGVENKIVIVIGIVVTPGIAVLLQSG